MSGTGNDRPTRRRGLPYNSPGLWEGVYMISPVVTVRVPESLEAVARARSPELASLTPSELLRAALAFLAGHSVRDAAELARGQRGVRLPDASPGTREEAPAA